VDNHGQQYVVVDAYVHALLPLLQQQAAQAQWGLALAWPELEPALPMQQPGTLQ